jgi:alpha-tubulin suppressor-like RCC1 family protein
MVIGGLSFKAVSSGGGFTCGITNDDLGYCWGSGFRGNLGNGSTANVSTPNAISGGLNFSVISAGVAHACGVTPDNELYCWGNNDEGQLGNGGTSQVNTPNRIGAGFFSFDSVSASFTSTCALAIDASLQEQDFLMCWGGNAFGQLGQGVTGGGITFPIPVKGDFPRSSITMGNNAVCGIVPPSSVNCFGNNNSGKFGNGVITSSSLPTGVGDPF